MEIYWEILNVYWKTTLVSNLTIVELMRLINGYWIE